RELLITWCAEYADELQLGVADVLDIVSEVALDIADIAGSAVHGHGFRARIEHGHAALALDVILPLVGIRMPMHLANAPRRYGDHSGRHGGRHREIGAVGDMQGAGVRLLERTR